MQRIFKTAKLGLIEGQIVLPMMWKNLRKRKYNTANYDFGDLLCFSLGII